MSSSLLASFQTLSDEEQVSFVAECIGLFKLKTVHSLVELLEKNLGVSAAAVVVAGGASTSSAEAETVEESEYDVFLETVSNKIEAIKFVRALLNLGLKEAKDLVESAPASLVKGQKKADAEALVKKIAEIGTGSMKAA